MLTSLIALSVCGIPVQAQTQNPGSPAYNPYNSPAVSIALTGVNLLKGEESEGDEPYLLVYQYGLQIPVAKDGTLQKPQAMPIRLVGGGGFDNLRSGYDWAKPNNQLKIRGFNTYFTRQPRAYVLFALAIFAFEHDEFKEIQLDALKRIATAKVRTALEAGLTQDPKSLIDPGKYPSRMVPSDFSPYILKPIAEMSTGKVDDLAGQTAVFVLSKPLGPIPGTPEDVVRLVEKPLRPNSVNTLSLDLKPPDFGGLAKDIYRGQIRLVGQIIRHR